MNLHLFLDVIAWIWGILFSAATVFAVNAWRKGEGDAAIGVLIGILIATLCWAWIIAG